MEALNSTMWQTLTKVTSTSSSSSSSAILGTNSSTSSSMDIVHPKIITSEVANIYNLPIAAPTTTSTSCSSTATTAVTISTTVSPPDVPVKESKNTDDYYNLLKDDAVEDIDMFEAFANALMEVNNHYIK
jgi:hypothetical protein